MDTLDRSHTGPWPRRRPLAPALVVLALHALLVAWLWQARWAPQPASQAERLLTVRLGWQAPEPAKPMPPQPRPAPALSERRPAPPKQLAAQRPLPAVAEPAITEEAAPTTAAVPPMASTSAAPPPLLDSEATRRAIRQAAREHSVGEQGALASGEPRQLRPEERLGQEVARSARGDCLKGEYFGGGAGLLSLPFLAAAVVRDKCRH